MLMKRFLQFVAVIFAFSLVAFAQTANTGVQIEAKRIERLTGLARVWGAVKYFHPFLATRAVDWDKALVETIPKVNAAKTSAEYRGAIASMLAVLNDKNTFVETENTAKTEQKINPNKPELVHLGDDGVLIIEALTIAETLAGDQSAAQTIFPKIFSSIPQAKAVVLDCRAKTAVKVADAEEVKYFFDDLLAQIAAQLTKEPIKLASQRYRQHNGYAAQGDAGGDTGYYSSLVTNAPQTLPAEGEKNLPVAVIINSETPSVAEVLSGLQATKRALIIQEGEARLEPSVRSYQINLPDGVRVSMRTTELVNPDGTIGFGADAVVPKNDAKDAALDEALKNIRENTLSRTRKQSANVESPQSSQDEPYAEMEFPAPEYRLLALFRFWNVINYFYPYKKLIGESWETVLPRYIVKFEANKDALDYQATVKELATEIHDSHAFVRGTGKFDENFGGFVPPVTVKFVAGETVVYKVLDDKINLKPGEVILSIDGETIDKRRERFARYQAASTPQALSRGVEMLFLRGQKDSAAKFTVRDAQGKTRQVEVARSISLNQPTYYIAFERTTPIVEILPSGFGYVDLARLQSSEVEKMFETIKNVPAVIFDMRGYPRGTAWAIAPRLTDKQSIVGALFSRRIMAGINLGDSDYAGGTNFTFEQYLPKPKGEVYRGKIVMLINERAVSQSEHTCLFFEAARPDIVFIGSPTVGANGDVTNMILPGGIKINFSGHEVRHADGRQLQRIGIQPTIKVEPTIAGIAEGKDEVLEAAVKFLQGNKK